MRRRGWMLLCFLAGPGLTASGGTQQSAGAPVVTQIETSCDAVLDVAVDWLGHHGVRVTPWNSCDGKFPCSFRLSAAHLRTVHRVPVLNFTGVYTVGGRWHSFLTAPHVSGSDGTMSMTERPDGACSLALKFTYHTQIDSRLFEETIAGPNLQSNGRLEGEYGRAIRDAAVKRQRQLRRQLQSYPCSYCWPQPSFNPPKPRARWRAPS